MGVAAECLYALIHPDLVEGEDEWNEAQRLRGTAGAVFLAEALTILRKAHTES